MLCHSTNSSRNFGGSGSFDTVGTSRPATQHDVLDDLNLQQRRRQYPKCCKISSLLNGRVFCVILFSFSWICMTIRRKLIYMFCAVGVKFDYTLLNKTSLSIMLLYWRWSCGTLLKRHKQTAKNGLFLEHLNCILYYCFEKERRRLVMEWFWMVNQVENALECDCGECWCRCIMLEFTVVNVGMFKSQSFNSV